jgi:hypothetical protein
MTSRPTPKWYEHMRDARMNEQTSKRVGSLAAGILSDPKSTPAQKSVAGSALTQRPDGFFRRRMREELDALKKKP